MEMISGEENGHAMAQAVMAAWQAGLSDFLLPVVVLVAWTLVMLLWLAGTRVLAMQRLKLDPERAARHVDSDEMKLLPRVARQAADNYNHLHEQPTLFYALMGVAALTGQTGPVMLGLAWFYVGSRILHSLVQASVNIVRLRFMIFLAGSIALMVMAGKLIAAMVGG